MSSGPYPTCLFMPSLLSSAVIGRGLAALSPGLAGHDELISRVDHHWLTVLDADRAAEAHPYATDHAGDLLTSVEHRGQVAGGVGYLGDENRVALHRTDLHDAD